MEVRPPRQYHDRTSRLSLPRFACAQIGDLVPGFSWADVELNARLGLPPLTRKPTCHSYQHGCDCSACAYRAEHGCKPRKTAPQPWEGLKAA